MAKKIKVALLGGGINSAVGYAHYCAIKLSNKAEIVAGCFSRHKQINIDSAASYNISIERTYDSIGSLLQNEKDNIDALVVLTPTDQHYAHVSEAIRNGVPVISEKALVSNLDEALSLKKNISDCNGFLRVIYNYLGYPMVKEMRSLISRNYIGRINHVQIEMPQEGFSRVDKNNNPVIPQDWRLRDGVIPTISLDLGVHIHMLVYYLTRLTPSAAVGISNSIGNFSGVKDNISSIILYETGMTCNMWYSKTALGNRNGLKVRVFGSEGALEWLQLEPEKVYYSNNQGELRIIDRGSIADIVIANDIRYSRFKVGHPSGFVEALSNYYIDTFSDLELYLENNSAGKFTDESFGISHAIEGIQLLTVMEQSAIEMKWKNI